MVCIGARGKTYSSLCQPVWISDQAAEPLKDFFTSILSEEDCFLCCIQDFLTVRFLVRGQVLHEPGDKASTGEILPLPFFFFCLRVACVQLEISWRMCPWWTGSSSRFGLWSEAHGSAEESLKNHRTCPPLFPSKDAEQTNCIG